MSPRVLLTGGSGFIATHILGQLLQKGYWVRTTIRSESRKKEILDAHPEHVSQLDFAIVKDIAQPGAFDDAVKAEPGLDYVVHTASPFHFHAEDVDKDLLQPAVQGTLGVLQGVKQFAPTVQRIVITGSFASIVDQRIIPGPGGKLYTEEDWNPITHEQAIADPVSGYYGSKTFAEKAAWEFMKTENPSFDLVIMCPPMVYGPIMNSQTASSLNTSNQLIYNILTGKTDGKIPEEGIHIWVDVRDLARAHVAALEAAAAANQRFLVKADGIYSPQDMADILRKHFPDQPIPVGKAGTGIGIPERDYFLADNSKSKKLLGMSYGNLENMLVPLAKSLLALEK
ncbi:3-beta hydroxysteroid dehydrogenase/isomerase family protein [Exidia glandulosa HHB12029]|uniref:3-beta hydroxysteroid dehydrogenase/isomerase family protein n=1 Tax=Exidia glandulosa HHB12029 TaxID=1314781 RepID=A0A165G892_EXIGL|nr:3-beta hydroxysteroid dehydrogenase/isomerase family protein [Exidia glandulosa HHB12029]